MIWSTGTVALDHHLKYTMDNNSVIQIGGPENGQCGTKAKANLACSCHAAPAQASQLVLFLQQLKIQ